MKAVANIIEKKFAFSEKMNSKREIQQKIEIISNVIQSIKNNPKFIKLLIYSMNSLENFVSPPNREIRVNARIIIKYDGIGTLRAIAQMNITNDEVVETAGDIIWKCISFNDVIDMELAKLFADSLGHEAVIEILLSKEKGESSKPYIKILNGLSQIPNLVHKLINSGLIETVKLVSDLYSDDFELIQMNFEIMKKISALKIGRETLIKKNLIPNILKNINLAAKLKNTKGVLVGLNIVDNVTRIEGGKEALKDADVIKNLSDILDFFENNDEVLRMGAKIYSKISKPEDILIEIEKIKNFSQVNDYSDLNELKKTLVLISNFVLVDDISKTLCEPDNLGIIKNLFIKISNIDLKDKSGEYIKAYVLLNKYFMIIFHRIFNLIPEFFENEEIESNINKSILNNWKAINLIRINAANQSEDELNSFVSAFSEFFGSFAEFFERNYSKKEPEEHVILSILDFFLNDKIFINDEKANNSACKIIKIANRIKASNPTIREKIMTLFDFLISTVKFSDDSETLNYALEILHDIYQDSFSKNQVSSLEVDKDGIVRYFNVMQSVQASGLNERLVKESVSKHFAVRDVLMKVVLDFMTKKPKHRKPNVSNLKILNITLIDPVFMDLYRKKPKEQNLVEAVISVMAKHLYESSNIFEVVAIEDQAAIGTQSSQASGDQQLCESTEKLISYYGIKILENLIDEKEIQRMLKILKDSVYSYTPGKSSPEAVSTLENSLIFFFCVLKAKAFFNLGLGEIVDSLKNLIKKEISFVENFKRDNLSEQKKAENYLDTVNASHKRLRLQTALLRLISDNCIKFYEDAGKMDSQANLKNCKHLAFLKEILKIIMDMFEKSTDEDNICDLLEHLRENVLFLSNNESELNATQSDLVTGSAKNAAFAIFGGAGAKDSNAAKFEETIIEKLTANLINLLRKNIDNIKIAKNVIEIFKAIVKKKPEICDLLVKAGCPRLLMSLLENTQDADIAKKALQLFKTLGLSSEENLNMLANQNIFDKIFEISTKFNSNDEIKEISNSIISHLAKLLDQERFLGGIISQAIREINTTCSKPDFKEKSFEESKGNLLENLEKINTFTNNLKLSESVFEPEFLHSLGKIQEKVLSDPEISETNDKLCFNLLDLEKKAFHNGCLKLSDKLSEKDFVDMLLGVVKEKSHFRDALLEALKTLSNLALNKDFFESFLREKVDKSLIDALFNANENYLDDLPVSSEINNLLCVLCLSSDELAKYIVEKGGLQNIIEEIRSLIKLNDPVSQSKKLFGLKFIESLVNDKENMSKFVQLKGADLVLSLMKSCIQFQDELNSRKIDELKNSENSQITKHNNFVVRNSVFNAAAAGNYKQSVFEGKKVQFNNKNNNKSEIESALGKQNRNALGSEIIEDIKNQNVLNGNSPAADNLDIKYSNSQFKNVDELNCQLDCLANYITETPIRIHESKKFSTNNNNNKLTTENKAENSDAHSNNNTTLDSSVNESNSSFAAAEDENKYLNEDLFTLEEIGTAKENLDDFENSLNNVNVKANNFIPYLVYCFKIIQLNLKFKMKDFVDPRLFRNVIQLLTNNFPNLKLFLKGVQLLNTLFKESLESNNFILEEKDKKKLTQLVFSNLAYFNTYKPLETSACNLLKNLNYDTNEFSAFLKIATESIKSKKTFNNRTSLDGDLEQLKSAKRNGFPESSEIRSRFLAFVALFAENLSSENPEETLVKQIESFFNKIVLGIYYTNDPADIGFTKSEGFCLAMVKLRLFLIRRKYPKSDLNSNPNHRKKSLQNLNIEFLERRGSNLSRDSVDGDVQENKLANINDKILRMGLSFFNPKTKFVNKFLYDFDEIYENLNIKYNPDQASFIMDYGKEVDKDSMKEFLSDFYDYKNTIFLQSFFFYDNLCGHLENSEPIPEDVIDTLNLIVNHVISCCDLRTDRNYLGSSVKKNSEYLMRFIMNEYLNEEKTRNPKINALLAAFWKMLYYVIKNDEINVFCANDELVDALINRINEEIKNNPKEEIYRKILSIIALRLENNLDLFNKILDNTQPEILALDFTPANEKNLTYDVEAISNLCRHNVTPRILMKPEKSALFEKLKQIYFDNSIGEKLKFLLANIFASVFKNKINHEKILKSNGDLVQKTLEALKHPSAKEAFEIKIDTQIGVQEVMHTEAYGDYQPTITNYNTNYGNNNNYNSNFNYNDQIMTEANIEHNNVNNNKNIKDILHKKDFLSPDNVILDLDQLAVFKKAEIEKKIVDKLIYPFVKFLKENLTALTSQNSDSKAIAFLDKNSLEKLAANFASDKMLLSVLESLIKNLSAQDKEKELADSLLLLKQEIAQLCQYVGEVYKEHCNQINLNNSSNDGKIADSRQDNIIRRSIRLSVQNMVAKISASSKKMSVFSQALVFTNQNSRVVSPLSCKDNEEIQITIEKLLNFLLQVYSEFIKDKDSKRAEERTLLMSDLLSALKQLSVAPSNHGQILEHGLLNFMETLNADVEENIAKKRAAASSNEKSEFEIPAFLQIENLNITKNCTTSESAIALFISSPVAEKIISEIFEIYKSPSRIQNDTNLRDMFRASNKIFSNLCQNKKGFSFVFEKLGLEKLLELARNTYDETIIDSILEMIINYINNNPKSEVEKYLAAIFMIVIKAYKVYDNNREMGDLLTKAVLIVGLLCSEDTVDTINQFDFVRETCKFDMNFLFNNVQFLNAFSFALGKFSYNNPKVARACFETGVIYKINDLIPENLNGPLNNNETKNTNKSNNQNNSSNSNTNKLMNNEPKEQEDAKTFNINFPFLENISILYRNILKNNLKIIPKFIEKNALAGDPGKQKLLHLKNSEAEVTAYMLKIMEKLGDPSQKSDSGNITIYNLAEAFELICMDNNAIAHLANTNFINICLNILTEKQSEAEIVKTLLQCKSNFFNKEIGNNLSNTNFEKILQILRGIQKKYYLNSEILMIINNIAHSLFNNLSKEREKDKAIREGLFNVVLESINIQDWNIPLLLTALKIIYEILSKKDNKYLLELIYDDSINSFLGIIRNHQNNSEVLGVAYKILALFADRSVYAYAMINNGLLELIQDSLVKLANKSDHVESSNSTKAISAVDLELKKVLFLLLEKLCQDKNSAKKIADAISENLIMELKAENAATPSPNAHSILKLFKSITQHPNTVESFLQQNGLECVLNFLTEDPLNVENDLNCLGILEHIAKNGNNYKKKLKDAKTVEVISNVMEKTKNVNKEITIIGGMIINDINDIQLDLQKSEDLVVEEVKKKNSPIKPEIKNFLTNGKIVKIIQMNGKKKQMLLIMTQDMLRIIAKKLESNSPPKDKYIIEISQIKKIVRGYANDCYTKSMGFFTKVFGNPPLPQKCFSIYANSREKEKVINVKCIDEKDANEWIENLKTVIEYMSKTKTIRNAVQFTSTYKK